MFVHYHGHWQEVGPFLSLSGGKSLELMNLIMTHPFALTPLTSARYPLSHL